jgi:hypothetical protein
MLVPRCAHAPTLDGTLAAGEWDTAAVVRDLWLTGNAERLPAATEFLLQYDDRFLFVAVRCEEREAGYPRAFPRGPTDQLCDDDAVQVVLGTADEHMVRRDVLNMGGYANALGQPVAAADHYYQFTVNSVGATSRTYNEGPLDRPLFETVIGRLDSGWVAELRIPFASAGISDPTQLKLFLNLFRFRPPDTAAWHLPAFGGYAPMPLGRLHLLPAEQADRRTVQALDARPEAQAAARDQTARATLAWYPLARRAVAEVRNGTAAEVNAALRVTGLPEHAATVAAQASRRLIVELPADKALPCTAEAVILAGDAAILVRETIEMTAVETPEWLGTQVAADYVSDRVPWPWTQPQVAGDTTTLQHGSLGFGSNGLYRAALLAGEELLSGQGEILIEAEGRTLTPEPLALQVTRVGNTAVAAAELRLADGYLDVRSTVEFDGFTLCKLRVRGLPPGSIGRIAVQFPLRPENARFVHRFRVQDIRRLTGCGWEGPAGPVWLGGNERGLAFDSDTPLFLSTQRRSQVQVIEEAGRTWLRLNLVDAAGQVQDDGHVFRFIVQPTPTRRVSLKKDGLFHASMWFEEWSDYEGYPDLTKLPEVTRRAAEAHAKGKPFVVYFNQMLAENSPGFKEHRSEFIVPPGLMWYQRAYDPGRGVPCYVCCARGPYGDLLLHGMDRLAREADLDGVYMDGTSVPWECTNPAHRACDGTVPVTWDGEEPTPLLATRDFLKRVRGVFDRKGRAWMFAHTGGAINIATQSLCDGFYEGEQLSRYRPGYRLPLHTFAVGYCGIPWGFRTDTLPHSYGVRRMMTLAVLHDTEVGGEAAELEQRIFGDFQDDAAVAYHPYWRPQPHVRRLGGDVVFSYYRKADAAMLVVSNLTWERQEPDLEVSALFPGQPVRALDVDAQAPLPLRDGHVRLDLLPHRFAAVRIEPAEAVARPPEPPPQAKTADWRVAGFDPADWDLHPQASGVTVIPDWDLGRGLKGVKLTSTLYHDYGTATFTAHPVAANGTFRLRLQHQARFQIDIGAWCLQWDGQRWHLPRDPWREGTVYQPKTTDDQPHELVLSLREGRLDAVYAGQALARDVPVDGLGPSTLLQLRTWSGEWMAFTLLEAHSAPTRLFEDAVRHPVP